jgi:DNA polymerase elongation subunit (family B)
MKKQNTYDALVGGFVKEPKIGLSKWVVSFDLNSLYPHLIMQYNISPETFCGRLSDMPSIDQLLTGKSVFGANYRSAAGVSYAANGCYYSREKQGFLPALMEKMYNDRTKYKKMMIEAKKDLELVETEMKKRGIMNK